MARRKTIPKVEPETTIEEPKAEEPKAEEPKAEEPKAEETEEKTPRRKRYVATRVTLWHPFQRAKIYLGSPGTLLDEDSWLISQMERGLVREV